MIWIIWLLLFRFPQVEEYGTSRELAGYVLHSGEFGTEDYVVRQARIECQALRDYGCGP